MPDNLSQRLANELLRHDIDMMRVAVSDEQESEAAIAGLTSVLVSRLIRRDPTAVAKGFGQDRLDKLISEIRTIIRDEYQRLYKLERAHLIEAGTAERVVIPHTVAVSMGVSRSTGLSLVKPVDGNPVREIIDQRVITANANDAARMREFFEREAANHYRRAAGTLRQAFAQDETITQMITRLKNLTEIQARETASLVRTGYNHVINQLRIETMQRNSHLFRGVIAITVLDGRTSKICISRSRGMWDLNTGRPLPESPVQMSFPGPTPWHIGERTQLYPLTRDVREVGRMGDSDVKRAISGLTKEQRELLSVNPPDDETYTQWLRRQSRDVQNQVLGPTRRKMWLNGELELTDLVNQRGRPLTLEQLRKKGDNAA